MVNVAMIGVGAISGIYLKNITETFKEIREGRRLRQGADRKGL